MLLSALPSPSTHTSPRSSRACPRLLSESMLPLIMDALHQFVENGTCLVDGSCTTLKRPLLPFQMVSTHLDLRLPVHGQTSEDHGRPVPVPVPFPARRPMLATSPHSLPSPQSTPTTSTRSAWPAKKISHLACSSPFPVRKIWGSTGKQIPRWSGYRMPSLILDLSSTLCPLLAN